MRSLTVRLQALLLLLTLVGGSFGLPVFDAVVYHSALAQAQPSPYSIAGESASSAHGVTCAIDLANRCGTGIAPFAELEPVLLAPTRIAPQHVTDVVPASPWLASSHSRAPPSTLS